MDNEVMKFGGRLTYKEFKKFNHYHLKKIFQITFVAIWIICFLINLISMSWIPALVISLIITILAIILVRILLIFRVRNEFQSDRVLKKEVQFVVHDNGVNILIENSITQYDWNDIISFQQYKEELFLLYVSKNKAIVIPRRYFSSVQDIQLFKRLISTNLSKKNR
ncbi:YcxB family protein [Sporolactobacillus kofuensis]|uniref:YcxB family protein n=1 Tax=Sporolactobacillus kofuensis TaxID=269672 RepID=A0ABW1WGB5_9BACL|nr:YcxB family protein [Sporolactobacillus kofuensis]MCO7176505.1 YcxB family protein [Sporolactobacillus kofuensis]